MTRSKSVLVMILLVAIAFLAGLLFGYMQVWKMQAELETGRQELSQLRTEVELGSLRDLAGVMYVETMRKNYGLAQDLATRYFDSVTRLTQADASNVNQARFHGLVDLRDRITTLLATADPSAEAEIQGLYLDTHRRTAAGETAPPGVQATP